MSGRRSTRSETGRAGTRSRTSSSAAPGMTASRYGQLRPLLPGSHDRVVPRNVLGFAGPPQWNGLDVRGAVGDDQPFRSGEDVHPFRLAEVARAGQVGEAYPGAARRPPDAPSWRTRHVPPDRG